MRWLALLLLVGGCTGSETTQDNGPCGPNGECATGFSCNPATNRCVKTGGSGTDAPPAKPDGAAAQPDATPPDAAAPRPDAPPGTPDASCPAPAPAAPGLGCASENQLGCTSGAVLTCARSSGCLVWTVQTACTDPTPACDTSGGTPHCAGTTWALWPMPDSVTIFCSDGTKSIACPGNQQDGDVRLNVPTYTTTADTVSDSVTKLLWQRAVPATQMTPAAAKSYCAGLSLGGASGWRLPSRIELATLLDLGRAGPTIDGAFPSTPQALFWTASPYLAAGCAPGDCFFTVDFTGGKVFEDSADSLFVRCVLSRVALDAPAGRYTVTADTVADTLTGLLWQRGSQAAMTWSQALAGCDALVLPAFSDWRLPSAKELMTIVDETRLSPAVDPAFSQTNDLFWTSTPLPASPDRAWTLDFDDGTSIDEPVTTTASVRCVR